MRALNAQSSVTPLVEKEEISTLIETLTETERGLEEISGEVDTVLGGESRPFLLRRAQMRLGLLAPGWCSYRWDFGTNELACDLSLDELFGLPAGQTVSSLEELTAIVHPDDWFLVSERRYLCKPTSPDLAAEFRILWPDGSVHWLEDKGKAFFDADGKPLYMTGACGDITQRKAAEMELRDSKEKFQQLADNITDAFWILSADPSKVEYVSPAFEKIWGRSVKSLEAQHWREFIFPKDQKRVLQAFELLSIEAPRLDLEYRIVRPDGELRWVRVRAFQIRDADGQLIRHMVIATDVTECHHATQALRATEDDFRTLSEAMPQIVWVTRADGWTFYLNQQWTDYTGRTLEEGLGEGWVEAFHPDDQLSAREAWQHAYAETNIFSIEARIQRADGLYRWWLCRAIPLKDAAGNVLKWIGTSTDIDALKLAQEQLRQQAALLDIAQDAILVKDLENRIIYWNKGAERIYGWTREDAIGCRSIDLLYQNHVAHANARAALLSEGRWEGEMVNRKNDGTEITADVRWTLVKDGNGEAKSILAIHTDITGRKKMQEQFLRGQRMESIGTLASGIAHDLNNVLAPIMMSVEMLGDLARTPADQTLLDTLQNCTQRGAALIKQVLSFARGVEGKRVPVHVVHVINDLKRIVRDTFPKNISFLVVRPPELGTVLGDSTQLYQVFMNLAVNSRDAMPNGGKLTITLENVVVDELYADMNPDAKAGPYTMVKVEDTGSGIPLAIQNRIFEPFFTTKEIGNGTGLGLSTTIGIIKSHGGFINLYSELGKGAQFKVYLPAVVNAAASKEKQAPESRLPNGHGELILVVDDEESIRIVTQKILERHGYRVLVARNGAEGVAAYAKGGSEISLVLTDMAMPIMDGPALVAALMILNPHVHIIGCSGQASIQSLSKAIGSAIQHFIPKPYTTEILLKMLRRVLDGEAKIGLPADSLIHTSEPNRTSQN